MFNSIQTLAVHNPFSSHPQSQGLEMKKLGILKGSAFPLLIEIKVWEL